MPGMVSGRGRLFSLAPVNSSISPGLLKPLPSKNSAYFTGFPRALPRALASSMLTAFL